MVRTSGGADPLCGLSLDAGERAYLETMKASAGFRFTVGVQRSWCVGRAKRAGQLTLSILSEPLRRSLLEEWTESGGGTSSFFQAEAEALLNFIASRLPDPSHERSACRFEQATLRASSASENFTPPDPDFVDLPGMELQRGRSATVVLFHGKPEAILEALLLHRPVPSIMPVGTPMLFAPGLEGLCRIASPREADLWEKLARPVSREVAIGWGYTREELLSLLQVGAVELRGVREGRRWGKPGTEVLTMSITPGSEAR
jgi:hypothetical protein